MKILKEIQDKLKVPKNQRNKFGNYNYRSCEDILEAVKPLLGDALLTLSDEMVDCAGRPYVKGIAKLKCGDEEVVVHGFARDADQQKGMDAAQITGSASSYARKYALNGMFLIDDTKDSDFNNTSKDFTNPKPEKKQRTPEEIFDGTISKMEKLDIAEDVKAALIKLQASDFYKGLTVEQQDKLVKRFDAKYKILGGE